MKAEASILGTTVSQALTKGTCPIYAILKDFQWTLAEPARPQSNLRLCNFHGWTLARSRGKLSLSTPGESVTNVFLEMLKVLLIVKVSGEECALCRRVLEKEVTRLRELAEKLQGAMCAQWMKSQGTLCLEHARKVKEFAPLRLRTVIDENIERNRVELERELENFREQLKHGIHQGGGLLDPAAEFLVSQRGL